MPTFIRGAASRLYISGSPVTGEKGLSVNLSHRLNEHASFSTPNDEVRNPELYSWNANADGLLTDPVAQTLITSYLSNAAVPVNFRLGQTRFYGSAIITDLKFLGSYKGKAKWSLSLKGSGLLS